MITGASIGGAGERAEGRFPEISAASCDENQTMLRWVIELDYEVLTSTETRPKEDGGH